MGGSLYNSSNAFINITSLIRSSFLWSSLWRRSCTLSTLILVFWTSRSLHLNNSSIWIISIIISGVAQKIIFGNQSMIFAMSCISLLGSVVWGHHMYTVGLETDTRAYFTGVTILISLPTGTKIFNWLSTYLGNLPFLQLRTSSALFALLFLLMFTIGGSTGVILGNAALDLALHDTYYVVAHFHFVLSLGAVIAIFSAVIFNGENILGSKSLLPSSSCTLSLYHLVLTFVGILLTFSPMHFLGFNVLPRRIPDFPDSFHSWNFLSSIGSGITLLSFAKKKKKKKKKKSTCVDTTA